MSKTTKKYELNTVEKKRNEGDQMIQRINVDEHIFEIKHETSNKIFTC